MIKKILLSFLTLNLIFFSSLIPQQKAEASSVNFLERELKPRYLPEITDPKISTDQERSASGDDSQTARKKTERFVGDLIVTALQFLGGSIVLLIIIYALKMVIAFGNDEEIANSKKALGNLALGLLLIMLSYSITLFILDLTLIPQEIQASEKQGQPPQTPSQSSASTSSGSTASQ